MVKVGEHIALDLLGIKQDYTPKFFGKIIYKIAKAAKVEILNVSQHKFKPQGFTLVALLAESHMSFHTFPEKNIISFDFFTCAKISPSVALDILKKEIKHERIVVRKFDRSTVGLYDDIYSTPGQKKYYVVNKVHEDFVSKVGQHIEILELEEFGKSLFIDNELQVSEKDEHIYSGQFVDSAMSLNSKNSNAAIIGGGDGGVARECLSRRFNFVDWFELDPEVVSACTKHLSKIGRKIKESKGSNGFDARYEKYVDMLKAGIIDPTLVTRTAVQNAASIAGLLLTTEATVSDKPEPPSAAPAMPGGDMGGMGGMS